MAKLISDTGWRAPDVRQTVQGPIGEITPATGIEAKPCLTCRSWDKDNRKLMEYLNAHGLTADAEGYYETPIVNDFKDGRRSMRIHPKDFGYCRRLLMPTHWKTSCEDWRPTETRAELQRKIAP